MVFICGLSIHPLKKNLLSVYHVLGILLDTGYSVVTKKKPTIPALIEDMVCGDLSNNQVDKQANIKW